MEAIYSHAHGIGVPALVPAALEFIHVALGNCFADDDDDILVVTRIGIIRKVQ